MKHTKGKWIARINNIGIDIVEEKSGFGIVDLGNERILNDCDYPIEEAKANAKLIAEAGTVTNETGYTPRQLADQKAELLEALDELRIAVGNMTEWDRFLDEPYKKAMKAIKKA